MMNIISKLRALFRGVREQAGVIEFYYPRHRTQAADPLAVLMITHRWTAS